jgi:5-formyltetrahydrofolate cyclo-ligase
VNSGSSDEIRKLLSASRKILSREQVTTLSQEVISRFSEDFKELTANLESPGFRVAFYRALPGELNLLPLETLAQQKQWRLYFPRVMPSGLEFVEMTHRLENSSAWQTSSYGINEPQPELDACDPDELDLIFIPGVAFGELGERIGRGAGYYDRFIPKNTRALRVALTFDFQVLPVLPQRSWDQSVHWIMTEKREFNNPYVYSWWKQRALV